MRCFRTANAFSCTAAQLTVLAAPFLSILLTDRPGLPYRLNPKNDWASFLVFGAVPLVFYS